MEKTLVLIKPHVWEDYRDELPKVIGKILEQYTGADLKVRRAKHFNMDFNQADLFYSIHRGKPFFEKLLFSMTGNCIAFVLEGEGAIEKVRKINGATNPKEAAEGTLRWRFGRMESGPNNAVHGSDSVENAKAEIRLIFGDK